MDEKSERIPKERKQKDEKTDLAEDSITKKTIEEFVKNKEGIIIEFSVILYQIADKLKNKFLSIKKRDDE